MALIHRALLTWFLVVLFLVLIVIRLESKSAWSWFIVFIPMWMFNAIVLIYSTTFVINRCKSSRNLARNNTGAPIVYFSTIVRQRLYFIAIILLKMTGEVLLCLRLDLPLWNLPLTFVLIPFWFIFAAALVSSARKLGKMATSEATAASDSHLQPRPAPRRISNPSSSGMGMGGIGSHNYGIRARRGAGDGDGAEGVSRVNRAAMAAMAMQ